MSNELHNTLRALGETWLGLPGWAWALIVLAAVALFMWESR